MIKVFVDGSAGTTGLRIADRLAGQCDIRRVVLPEQLRKDKQARAGAIADADVAFLCLPDAAAIEAVSLAGDGDAVLIDTSTAHRVTPGWAYGFPELSAAHRAALCGARRIAVPGCHASGFLALVYPLVAQGVLPADYPISVFSLTGYSGGGKQMIAQYEDASCAGLYASPAQYALHADHKHLPEMQAVAHLSAPPAFQPVVAAYYAGMQVTLPLTARLMTRPLAPAQLLQFYRDYYADCALISVESVPDGKLYAGTMAGRDSMRILVGGSEEHPLAIALFDNLGKGASGAALQCMNLAMGREETTGLVL